MDAWSAKLGAMAAEWRGLQQHWRTQLVRWERCRLELESEEAVLRDQGQWTHGRCDYLGVLGKQRDELAHSRIVAWLLDPCAHHGFGVRVLRDVVAQAFGEVNADLRRARTRCEVALFGARLDIVVEAPGLCLVIENKVDAEEAEGQCDHYRDQLGRADARFMLLSPDGRRARTETAFVPLSYPQLKTILARALTDTPKGACGRHVAEDYLSTLTEEFS